MYRIVREQNLLRKSKYTKEINGVYKTRNKNSKQISAKMFSIHFHQKMKVKSKSFIEIPSHSSQNDSHEESKGPKGTLYNAGMD